jgi:AmmeMemoRadiSam system protein A
MGTLDAEQTLAEAIRFAAHSAALHDPRFPPLAPHELRAVRVELSVLGAPSPLRCLDELELGRHGVIVRRGDQRGLFLPQVAIDHGLDKEAFLSRCASEKAGLGPDAWREPGTEVSIFSTVTAREAD